MIIESPTSLFELRCPALTGTVRVHGYTGREELSRCFSFAIDLSVAAAEPGEVARAVVREAATLVSHAGSETALRVSGIVRRARLVPNDRTRTVASGPSGASWVLRLALVPRLWLLGRGRSYRIFQGQSVLEIVRTLLENAHVPLRVATRGSYAPREYCVQYDESDLAFIERILAEEGIHYTFDCSDDDAGDVVVIADGPSPLGDVLPSASIAYRPEGGMRTTTDSIHAIEVRRTLEPRSTLLRAFDYQRPLRDIRVERRLDAEVTGAHGEVYRHLGTAESPRCDPDLAARRLEQDRREARMCDGRSRHRGLRPGVSFEIVESPEPDAEGIMHIVSVEHHARLATEGATYENEFSCVPDGIVHRPEVPSRTLRQVLETATVVGPPGQEIHTDDLGRIKVKFHWDLRGATDDHASCWIRAMQPWAGDGWGFQFVPRVGMEVVVGFLGGNVDAPIVLGAAPNALHPPPYPAHSSKTKSGIKTRSSRNGTGYNELAFEDRTGHERLSLRAERDMDVTVQNNETHRVGATLTDHVQGNRFSVVGGNVIATIGGNVVSSVAGDATETTAGSHGVHVLGNLTTRVVGKGELLVEGDRSDTVKGRERITVEGGATRIVKGDAITKTQGSSTLVVGSASAPRSYELFVEGRIGSTSTGETEIRANEKITIRCGDSAIVLGPDAIELSSPNILLSADGAWSRLAEGAVKTHADKKFVAQADDKVILKGKSALVSLSDAAKIDGSKVQLKESDEEATQLQQEEGEPTTIVLVDQDDRPLANQRFILRLEDGSERSGILDADGQAVVSLTGSATIAFPDAGTTEEA